MCGGDLDRNETGSLVARTDSKSSTDEGAEEELLQLGLRERQRRGDGDGDAHAVGHGVQATRTLSTTATVIIETDEEAHLYAACNATDAEFNRFIVINRDESQNQNQGAARARGPAHGSEKKTKSDNDKVVQRVDRLELERQRAVEF